MEDTITEASHLMNKPAVVVLIISIGRQWMVVAIVVVLNMCVVEEGVGLVLDGTTTGEMVLTTQKMNGGTAEPTPDGRYPVLVRTQHFTVISYHYANFLV